MTIKNDEELGVVQTQLSLAESIVIVLQRDVLPINIDMYNIMSEPWNDVINELKRDISEYSRKTTDD